MKLSTALLFAASAAAVAHALPNNLEERKDNYVRIDDSDKLIKYSGKWTHANHQDKFGVTDYMNSESYSNDVKACYSFKNTDGNKKGYSFLEIHAGKKFDRGKFEIYADGKKIGSGDAYDPKCKSKCKSDTVARVDLYAAKVKYGQTITIKNIKKDNRIGKTPYLDLDLLLLTPGHRQ